MYRKLNSEKQRIKNYGIKFQFALGEQGERWLNSRSYTIISAPTKKCLTPNVIRHLQNATSVLFAVWYLAERQQRQWEVNTGTLFLFFSFELFFSREEPVLHKFSAERNDSQIRLRSQASFPVKQFRSWNRKDHEIIIVMITTDTNQSQSNYTKNRPIRERSRR